MKALQQEADELERAGHSSLFRLAEDAIWGDAVGLFPEEMNAPGVVYNDDDNANDDDDNANDDDDNDNNDTNKKNIKDRNNKKTRASKITIRNKNMNEKNTTTATTNVSPLLMSRSTAA